MTGKWTQFVLGMVTGVILFAGVAAASQAANGVYGEPSSHPIFVDGSQVVMTAYTIAGNNYVKLRDIGKALDFNVYWKNGVQIDSHSPYTGKEPEIEIPDGLPPTLAKPNLENAHNTSGNGAEKDQVDVEAVRQEILQRTNDLRKEYGLPVLAEDLLLMQAAQVRAEEMAATSGYAHVRPDGSKRTTVTDCPYTSENIHCILSRQLKEDQGGNLAKIAVEEWAASETHLQGMLDQERSSIGVGVAKGVSPSTGKECWYCVQWFLRSGYTITWVDAPITQK